MQRGLGRDLHEVLLVKQNSDKKLLHFYKSKIQGLVCVGPKERSKLTWSLSYNRRRTPRVMVWVLSNLGRKGVITFVPSQVWPPDLNKPDKSGRQKKKKEA